MGSNQEAKGSCPDPELTNDLRKLCRPVFPSSLSFLLSPSPTTHRSYGYFSKITLCPFLPPTQPERKQGKDKNIAWEERARTSPPNVAPVLSVWGGGGREGRSCWAPSSQTTVPLCRWAHWPSFLPARITEQQAVGLGSCLVFYLIDFLI